MEGNGVIVIVAEKGKLIEIVSHLQLNCSPVQMLALSAAWPTNPTGHIRSLLDRVSLGFGRFLTTSLIQVYLYVPSGIVVSHSKVRN